MSLATKLTTERRARLSAERMLELKQAELFAANRKLGAHAQQLTEEIVETRAEVESMRGENQRVKSDLSAANQRIAITERRLWQSIETINDGFAFFNGDNKMIMANRAYLAVFEGLEDIRPGVDYVTILQILTDEGIVNTGSQSPEHWRLMMIERIQQPEPENIVIQLWTGQHIRFVDQRGPDGDMVSLGMDITATVAYERQLQEAREIAEAANRAKSAFLANMSHEIRTPMNGVVGMADVLTDTELNDEQKLYVETIRNSGEALLVIINDVLDYSKIEAKKLELHPQSFDLERAIQEILTLLQPTARPKGVSLVLDYDLFLPTQMIGDPGRLRQVLTNLVGNAVKFTAKGHVLVRVTGVTDEAAGEVALHFTIEDTGIGIPSDMIGHIFGEFNQVENERNRQFDGTGLGLAISKRLVDMMDGQIWVTSEEGEGACFGFKVTLGLTTEGAPTKIPNLAGTGQIFVVTDTVVTGKVLARQLGTLGAEVVQCRDAAGALKRLSPATTLVLADHQMTNTSGLELARNMRAAGWQTPVLLFTTQPAQAETDTLRDTVQGVMPYPPPRSDLAAQVLALTNNEPATDSPLVPLRILAAEDNKTNQLVFRKMIKALDVDLSFANNGEEAVTLFQQIKPDLVFMDISMPKMDGKQATQAIRALEQGSGHRVPIVALTAHAMEGDDAGILAAGLDHYLTKPLRKPQIIGQIEAAHTNDMRPLYPDQEDG